MGVWEACIVRSVWSVTFLRAAGACGVLLEALLGALAGDGGRTDMCRRAPATIRSEVLLLNRIIEDGVVFDDIVLPAAVFNGALNIATRGSSTILNLYQGSKKTGRESDHAWGR